ncbi:MAG: CinA family nicotinamide mononucleotide deamidase-related protein [Lactobacillaceae bacterium]|jgi:nicotinamide-nucleotide amidase|nr:CinA family nicotinamide mononucleotide deamidase-related protein [Lactobacillaceae bacterium]
MNAEIISVGTELLLGQIVDTNRPFIARELSEIGINSFHQSVVGDNYDRMIDEINLAYNRSDLVILLGGLGPTEDDLTKKVTANFLNEKLVTDKKAIEKLKIWHKNAGIEMASNNQQQALYLNHGDAIPNDVGFAVGVYYQNQNGADFLLLPGPPWELQPMFNKYVKQLLVDNYLDGTQLNSLILRYFGIGESRLTTLIKPIIEAQTNPTVAPYIKKHEVTLRLTAKADKIDQAKKMNQALANEINNVPGVGSYFYGIGDDNSLLRTTYQALFDSKITIGIAETFTQGQLQSELHTLDIGNKIVTGGFTGTSAILDLTDEDIEKFGENGRVIVDKLAALTQTRLQTNLGLAIISEKSLVDPNNNGYVVEKVWFGLKFKDNKSVIINQVFAKDHQDNLEDAAFVALDLVRRVVMDKPIIERA